MAAAVAEDDRPRILYADSGPEPPFPLRMEGTVISGFGRGSKELGIPTANLPVDETVTPWIADIKSGVYFGYASLALPSSHPDRNQAKKDDTYRHRSNPRAPADAPPAPLHDPPLTTITSVTTASETFPSLSSSTSAITKEAPQNPSTNTPATTETPKHWQIYPMVMSIGYNPFYKNSVRSAEVHVLRHFNADFYSAPMRLLVLGFVREERDYDSLDALVRDINIDCEVARASLARPGWTPREGKEPGELDGSWLVR
ncbi:riboflavin kinase [Hypoxylon trugodes]|uniref:riboflavin kinase n=1 Tax=Hypoxylon trugodes TaxID=326681 RepID=UPI002195B1F1|nr:riboflavin kinase [Hypoxylon trugodes]KAI1387510.1 riboflavin kinase [Hypoxylon trugodes]